MDLETILTALPDMDDDDLNVLRVETLTEIERRQLRTAAEETLERLKPEL